MHYKKHLFGILIIFSAIFISCGDDESNMEITSDSFDRKEMLQGWADQIIIPAFQVHVNSLADLQDKKNTFNNDPSIDNLQILRTSYLDAYRSWQKIAFFDIGKAEEIGLRNFSNIYPTDGDLILDHIETQTYNLELPSNFDAQGFPALDFLLFGTGDSDEAIVIFLKEENAQLYLDDLIERIYGLTNQVLQDWNYSYREIFISNDGASATASVDKLVNDYLFYFEKFLRAGKIGIPAGIFSGNPLPDAIEAPYSKIYSKDLFLTAFTSIQDFFSGKSFDGNSQINSLEAYVDHINQKNKIEEDLSAEIINQWSLAEEKIMALPSNFKEQIIEDNSKILKAYDEIQKSVILLKVDMMQALNIQVDYVDADGD